MSFKADTSFLRFLTMGAAGVRSTVEQLSRRGFVPIELERYCGSNKIWATKVKRLRLPDLLCVRTGMRVEVKAKSKLEIKMSDAPTNPDRVWDAGMRGEDLVAFVASSDGPSGPVPAEEAVFFTVDSMRDSVDMSKLGQPKSASEGAERDRTWPATVTKRDGKVLSVDERKIVVLLAADAHKAKRRQTYQLKGKTPYFNPGQTVRALVDVLSGAPANMASLDDYVGRQYDPLNDLESHDQVDRYAAAKSLRHRQDPRERCLVSLERTIRREPEARVKLEAAGSAAFMGSGLGEQLVRDFIWENEGRADLRMEAVLLASELVGTRFSRDLLRAAASADEFLNDELRQAAVWGLGKKGLGLYEELIPYLGDEEENVALHAIAAFGTDAPPAVVDALVDCLLDPEGLRAAAASEALKIIDNTHVYERLIEVARNNPADWVLATLGRLSGAKLREALDGDPILERISPMLLLNGEDNWLATDSVREDVQFLLKQNY